MTACTGKAPRGERGFWMLVRKTDSCWLWLGARSPRGYGKRFFRGKHERAHRVSWVLANGEIPAGLAVCHLCDNPLCVRPAHLFLGTVKENNADRSRKGRDARGERQHLAKLKTQDVLAIRRMAKAGVPVGELAKRFGVDWHTASQVVRRETWRHVAEEVADAC